jgi:Rieske 2Fe-2S family protein
MTLTEQRTMTDLAGLVARRTPGLTLEAPFYTDPAVYAADLDAVWGRTWLFVAIEAEVREPGDYVTVDVGPRSVVVVRDDDEQIRALLNVCRHRGARLLEDRSGSVGNIVCSYHQWIYSPDGTLLHAGDQPPSFDTGASR